MLSLASSAATAAEASFSDLVSLIPVVVFFADSLPFFEVEVRLRLVVLVEPGSDCSEYLQHGDQVDGVGSLPFGVGLLLPDLRLEELGAVGGDGRLSEEFAEALKLSVRTLMGIIIALTLGSPWLLEPSLCYEFSK